MEKASIPIEQAHSGIKAASYNCTLIISVYLVPFNVLFPHVLLESSKMEAFARLTAQRFPRCGFKICALSVASTQGLGFDLREQRNILPKVQRSGIFGSSPRKPNALITLWGCIFFWPAY